MTNKRKIFLELFNLNESASIDDIKKRYHELAKMFHPDKNREKNAHERFLLIKEAYDYLINTPIEKPEAIYYENVDLEKERIEKIRIAKEKLNLYYKKKKIEREKMIFNFFNGNLWKLYKVLTFFCLFYSIINFVDYFLPKDEIKTYINEISVNYNSLNTEQIILIKSKNGNSFFCNNKIRNYLKENDSVNIYLSKILNKTYNVRIKNNFDNSIFSTLNNNFFFVFFLTIVLFFPLLILVNNEYSLENIFLIRIMFSIYLPFIIYLIIN